MVNNKYKIIVVIILLLLFYSSLLLQKIFLKIIHIDPNLFIFDCISTLILQ
jgi:hypothetical protein